MADIFFSPLSSVITTDQIPESLNFIETGLDTILDKVFFKDLKVQRSSNFSSTAYDLDIVIQSGVLKLEIPGTGLLLLLNPDLDNPNGDYSVIPVSLTWDWGILQYFQDYKANSFSFSPKAIADLILDIAQVSDQNLLIAAAYNFISISDPLDKFVVDANNKYSNLNIPYPLDANQDVAVENILTAIDQYPDLSLYELLLADYIIDPSNLNKSLQNVDVLFSSVVGYNIIGDVKALFIPKISASLELSAGLEIPRSVLIPVKASGEIEEDESIKTVLLFEAGELTFSSDGGFGFDEFLSLSFPAAHPKAQIGNTGLVIGFTNAKLDVSRTSNIPEADAAGYPTDFVGLYVQEASIEFNRFGQDDTSKQSVAIVGDNLLIGTGGISGTIGLETTGSLHRNFGSFDIELDKFSLTFRQNAITGSAISGKLTIPGFKTNNGPAVVLIDAAIKDNGDFDITAKPQAGGFPITIPDVLEVIVRKLEVGSVNGRFFVSVAGTLNFIANLPVLGEILPKGVEINKLTIWDNGDLEFEGGFIAVPKSFRLQIGPVNMEVGNISLGAHSRQLNGIDRNYRFFGFDGMINTGRAGVNASGNGIKYFFTTDNNGQDRPFDQFLSIDQILIDLSLPGDGDNALTLNGYLNMHNPDPAISGSNAGSEYTGAVAFEIPKLHLSGSAGMRLDPSIPAFVVDIGLELAKPIPLGGTGLGIYAFRGLIGQHYMPAKSATTPSLPDTATWWDYYKAKSTITGREGIELDKFADKPGFSVGAGMSIATTFDSGFTFSSKLFLLLGMPDVFLMQGQAGILRNRIGLKDDIDPPFSALIVIGDNSVRGNLSVNYNVPESGSLKGAVFGLQGTLDMAFFFNNASGWYLNIGKDNPESERIQAKILTLFKGHAYLMISSQGIKVGAGASFDFNKSFGPVGVGFGAYLNLGGFISFKPIQIGGFIQAGGYAYIKVWKFKLGLAVDLTLAVEAPNPFNISGSLQVKLNLPWPLPDVKFALEMSWHFNNNQHVLLEPLPVLQLPDPEKGYLPAVAYNILSKETFQLNYLTNENSDVIPVPGDAAWKYNFNVPQDAQSVTIPLDSFIDIELLKPVKPGTVALGGAGNQLPDGYMEMLPPKKGINDQVRHEFEISGLDIFAWKEDGTNSGWVPYNIYEAVTAIVHENTGASAIDLSQLKPGYWQFVEPNRYNKIRLLSQNMFSYADGSTSTVNDLNAHNFNRGDVFCFDRIKKEMIVNWKEETSGTVYPSTASTTFQALTFNFTNVEGEVQYDGGYGNESLRVQGNTGLLVINFPKPVTSVKLELGGNQNNVDISFMQTVYKPGLFSGTVSTDQLSSLTSIVEGQQNQVVAYDDISSPVDKILLKFHKDKAPGFEGELVIGGYYQLPDKFLTPALPLVYRYYEQEKALMFVAFYNKSFSAAEVLADNYQGQGGRVGSWPLNNDLNLSGANNAIFAGSPGTVPGYYAANGTGELVLNNVYSYAASADALVVPYDPVLQVETGNFSFEATAIFDPFSVGISTLLYKVKEDAKTGLKKGYALHLCKNSYASPEAAYHDITAVPSYTIWLTFYSGTASSGIQVKDTYATDCLTGRVEQNQYKQILVSVDRNSNKLEVFVDKILKASVDIPAELAVASSSGPAFTYLNQLSYLTEELQARLEDNGVTEAGLISEVQVLSDGMNRTVQPVWRPDTTFAVRLKTRDRVNGTIPANSEKTHVFGFKTAGPVGHFHQQNKQYQELAASDRAGEFKLASLTHYIDYERSFPDAQGRYNLSKPVFWQDPQVKLFFTAPYTNAMYSNWDRYQGLTGVNSRLDLQLLDTAGNVLTQQLAWEPVQEFLVDGTNVGTLPSDQQVLYYMNQAASEGSCKPVPVPLKKRLKQGTYQFPDLYPNRLYTALFTAVYQPEGSAEQKAEVHKFGFMSSRYATFQEQASSFIVDHTVGAEKYAIYAKAFSLTNQYINDTLKKLINDSAEDDPAAVQRYAVKYERLLFGGLMVKDLEPIDTTVINLLVNTNPDNPADRRVLGILVRNPEPFNDPKLTADLLSDTMGLTVTLPDNTAVGPEAFNYIYSRDTSAVFITNGGMNVPVGNLQMRFVHRIFNGSDYITLFEEYNSPAIDLSTYFSS